MYAACYCYQLGFKSICLLAKIWQLTVEHCMLMVRQIPCARRKSRDFDISVPGTGETVMAGDDFAYYLEQYAMSQNNGNQ